MFFLKKSNVVYSYKHSFLPKIEEICHIAKMTSASIIRISDSKLGETILASELLVDSNDFNKIGFIKERRQCCLFH